MRLFVSVEVPPFHVPGLGPSSASAPHHLTLKFLGEVVDERVGEVGRALEVGLQGAHAFPFTLQGMGVFPSPNKPRVLWIGVANGRSEMEDLARRTEDVLAGVGFPREERPFSAHVTVRRYPPSTDPGPVRALVQRHAEVVFATGFVRSVELQKSELSSQGARHTVLLKVPLAPPAN
jgi:RNA 2',3'-cyclic 3'-phosphodiesterase